MIWPELQTVAQIAIGRVLNSLPEGLLIALFAWVMLQFLPRQNSGTRFAVWFVVLLAVAGLPLVGGVAGGHFPLATGSAQPLVTVPGPWGLVLFLAWILAAGVAMLRLAIGVWRLRELRESCVPIDAAELDPAVRETVAGLSVSRSVTLATSEHVSVPAAIGLSKPMIVLPAWALREFPPEELKIILLHESAHMRRWDDWTNLLQKIVRAVFLFHPAVLWIDNRLSLEREMACDDVVLAETGNPRGYAKCLIALLERSFTRRGWMMAQAVVNRAREASLRLAQILDLSRPTERRVWTPAVGLVGAFFVACLVVLPRAPQFVAFERIVPVIQTADAHPLLPSHSQIPAVAVIPAAIHTKSSPSRKIAAQVREQVAGHRLEQRLVVPQVIAAEWTPGNQRGLSDTAIGETNPSVVPVSETFLFVRTAQRVGPNTWVWSVGVWRVTLVKSVQDVAEPGSVTNRT